MDAQASREVGGLLSASSGLEPGKTVFVKQSDEESLHDWLEFRIGEELQRGDRVAYFRCGFLPYFKLSFESITRNAKQREFNAEYHVAKYFKLGGANHHSHDLESISNETWLLNLPTSHVNVLKPVAATFHNQGFVTFHDKFNCSVEALFGNVVSSFRLKLLSNACQQDRLFIFDRVALDICAALKWFHENKTVHLNVNPETVVLRIVTEAECEPFALMYPEPAECFCLTGFEMMKRLPVSRAPVLAGKKGFVPKEIVARKPAQQIGAAADIWQMGATLWWIISGLTADQFDHEICAHLIGEDRAYILDTCLESDPEDRPDLKTVVDRISKMRNASQSEGSGLSEAIRRVQRSAVNAPAHPKTFAELWKGIVTIVKGNDADEEEAEEEQVEQVEENDVAEQQEHELEPVQPAEEKKEPAVRLPQASPHQLFSKVVSELPTTPKPASEEIQHIPEPEGELTTEPCDYTGAEEKTNAAAAAEEEAAFAAEQADASIIDPSESSIAE